jgi:hypothetical protein
MPRQELLAGRAQFYNRSHVGTIARPINRVCLVWKARKNRISMPDTSTVLHLQHSNGTFLVLPLNSDPSGANSCRTHPVWSRVESRDTPYTVPTWNVRRHCPTLTARRAFRGMRTPPVAWQRARGTTRPPAVPDFSGGRRLINAVALIFRPLRPKLRKQSINRTRSRDPCRVFFSVAPWIRTVLSRH